MGRQPAQIVEKISFWPDPKATSKPIITILSVMPVLVTGIQPAQVIELKGFFDPTDVGSLDPRHKGGEDGV
ncbi:hypothetical protein ASG68_09575 [Rhizobium sp. Leaf453]|nr:hypothetical protein ASG50_22255 [Rhizobium sp. Leaf386]KQT00177.1 hypothetical protein ASG42_04850 [Rhizobium sp. Leaf391]KQT97182.1 hypothetical protein ASG68_09575 [Rhizobium sp. Leaf453]